jgi:hypothetical protein
MNSGSMAKANEEKRAETQPAGWNGCPAAVRAPKTRGPNDVEPGGPLVWRIFFIFPYPLFDLDFD